MSLISPGFARESSTPTWWSKLPLIDLNTNFNFDIKILKPSAKQMGDLAYEKFKKNDFEDLAYFEPKYLKEFKSN